MEQVAAAYDEGAHAAAKASNKRVDIHVRWNELENITALIQHTLPQFWEYTSVALSAGPLASSSDVTVRDRAAKLGVTEFQATIVDILMGLPQFEMPAYLGDLFVYFFIGSVAVSLLYPVIAARGIIQIRRGRFGVDKHGKPLSFCSFDGMVNMVLDFVNEFLYFGIMVTLLSAFACTWDGPVVARNITALPTFLNTSNKSAATGFSMIVSADTKCFSLDSPLQLGYMVVAGIAILAFYPLATLLAPNFQFQNRMLDVKYSQSFLIMEHQFDLLVAGSSVFFADLSPVVVQVLVSTVCLTLAVANTMLEPCLVYRFNWMKSTVFLLCASVSLSCLVYELAGQKMIAFHVVLGSLALLVLAYSYRQHHLLRREIIIAKPRRDVRRGTGCCSCCSTSKQLQTTAPTQVVPADTGVGTNEGSSSGHETVEEATTVGGEKKGVDVHAVTNEADQME